MFKGQVTQTWQESTNLVKDMIKELNFDEHGRHVSQLVRHDIEEHFGTQHVVLGATFTAFGFECCEMELEYGQPVAVHHRMSCCRRVRLNVISVQLASHHPKSVQGGYQYDSGSSTSNSSSPAIRLFLLSCARSSSSFT